ncbi:putative cyclopropane-fatty-acyl-phospholipid synthase protein [Botrytis fragariae]|uniref:Putative cyclopropane-fatty-acyl-phospholipid synthase protein n=1 Tax=Botrytis fragariae TaxID=1964551 RepID=A0A8H6EKQ5_9HELO|nr:putative cyclopropane-fatty-acyl-phospholipid synthase protein [Botrytis fragariae]KAF5875821.1 putative cyclopropane-fatty-acyl-phospholipid synthase protein [Botrytis fragariae]
MENSILSHFSSFNRSFILRTLSSIKYGRLYITMKDENETKPRLFGNTSTESIDSSEPKCSVIINSPNVWTRMSINADLILKGFSEALMVGELECDDLVALVSIIPRIQKLFFRPSNDSRRALQNASSHYDTSNALFSSFLSPDMSYSCPIWDTTGKEETLEEAQRRKVHNIIDKADIKPEHHILEIGGRWAYLAIEATLGEKRVEEAGLKDRIEILLCDYRQTPKPSPAGFDRIISVEMVEHVGEEYMETYFRTISELLNKENGIMVIQSTTETNQQGFHQTRSKIDTFMERYIFPGGYLPTVREIIERLEAGSTGSLELESVQSIGPHYVRTLRLWRESFIRNWDKTKLLYMKERGDMTLLDLETFQRRWIGYFSYCEAGFRAGILGNHVITAKRPQVLSPSGIVPL